MSITRLYVSRGQEKVRGKGSEEGGWGGAGTRRVGEGEPGRDWRGTGSLGPIFAPPPLLPLVKSLLLALVIQYLELLPTAFPHPASPPPSLGQGTSSGRIYGAGPCGEDPGINLSLFRSVIYIYCT